MLNKYKTSIALILITGIVGSMVNIYAADYSDCTDIYASGSASGGGDGSAQNPFTLYETLDFIKTRQSDGVTVHLSDGIYELDRPLELNSEHSGRNGQKIVFEGTENTVLSGGKKVNNWRETDKGIWYAHIPDITDTRALYVNNEPAVRAKSKYKYYAESIYNEENSEYEYDGITVSRTNFPEIVSSWENAELVWDVSWTTQRTPVKEVVCEDDKNIIFLKQPYFDRAMKYTAAHLQPTIVKTFYIENAIEFLDEPNEFYFDKEKRVLYYYPKDGINPNDEEMYVSALDSMVKLNGGESDTPVENIEFKNISFMYGGYNDVNNTGLAGMQADYILDLEKSTSSAVSKAMPAQLSIEHAKNIAVIDCEFKCIGSNAVSMYNDVSDSTLSGNVFSFIGGSAVSIGRWDHFEPMPPGQKMCSGITVYGNVINNAAAEFRGCAALSIYYAKNINILHNEISHCAYTGISAGWGWKVRDVDDMVNIEIAYNKIFDVNKTNKDGAHIYTLGAINNSSIHDNYLVKSGDWRGGIYCDAGSKNFSVYNNVVRECEYWVFIQKDAESNVAVYDNYHDTERGVLEGDELSIGENHLISDGDMPYQARQIIENAGIGRENADIQSDIYDIVPKKRFVSGETVVIEAEDYAESVNTSQTGWQHYRDGGVSIEDRGAGYAVVNTKDNDRLIYNFDVPQSRKYMLCINAARGRYEPAAGMPKCSIWADGVVIAENTNVPETGSWKEYKIYALAETELSGGAHNLEFKFVDYGFSLESILLIPYDELCGAPDYADGTDGQYKKIFNVQKDENVTMYAYEHSEINRDAYYINRGGKYGFVNAEAVNYAADGAVKMNVHDMLPFEINVSDKGYYIFRISLKNASDDGKIVLYDNYMKRLYLDSKHDTEYVNALMFTENNAVAQQSHNKAHGIFMDKGKHVLYICTDGAAVDFYSVTVEYNQAVIAENDNKIIVPAMTYTDFYDREPETKSGYSSVRGDGVESDGTNFESYAVILEKNELLKFTVETDKSGYYNVSEMHAAKFYENNGLEAELTVNGVSQTFELTHNSNSWGAPADKSDVTAVYLNRGENEIVWKQTKGSCYLYKLEFEKPVFYAENGNVCINMGYIPGEFSEICAIYDNDRLIKAITDADNLNNTEISNKFVYDGFGRTDIIVTRKNNLYSINTDGFSGREYTVKGFLWDANMKPQTETFITE